MDNDLSSIFQELRNIWTELFTGRDVGDSRSTREKLDTMPCASKDPNTAVAELLLAEAKIHRELVWALIGSTAPWAAEVIFQRGRLMLPVLLEQFAAARKRLDRGGYAGRARDEALMARITVLVRAIRAIRL